MAGTSKDKCVRSDKKRRTSIYLEFHEGVKTANADIRNPPASPTIVRDAAAASGAQLPALRALLIVFLEVAGSRPSKIVDFFRHSPWTPWN